jgi:predicted peptidase
MSQNRTNLKKRIVCFVSLAVFLVCAVSASTLEKCTFAREYKGVNGKIFRYRWAEKKSKDGSKVPLVVFLHGAGERGTDNSAQLLHGVKELVAHLNANEKGYMLVAGQVPKGKRWVEVNWGAKDHSMPVEPSETMGLLIEFLDKLLRDGIVDNRRIYVTGISMGGYGTWDLICRRPEMFAAAIPICGGGDKAQVGRIKNIPVWAFHGSADNAVPVCRSRDMVSALWKIGSNAHYREYPDAGHNVWTATYRDKQVLNWFFRQRRVK